VSVTGGVAGLEGEEAEEVPLNREPLIEESSWDLRVLTDGGARRQEIHARCDRCTNTRRMLTYADAC
jgi:hypothetical protein